MICWLHSSLAQRESDGLWEFGWKATNRASRLIPKIIRWSLVRSQELEPLMRLSIRSYKGSDTQPHERMVTETRRSIAPTLKHPVPDAAGNPRLLLSILFHYLSFVQTEHICRTDVFSRFDKHDRLILAVRPNG